MSMSRVLSLACTVMVAAALLSQLAACGYRLSGHSEEQKHPFSAVLKRVSIEGLGQYEPFRKTLITSLRGYGIKTVVPGHASARLLFSDLSEGQRRSAVGDDVKAREYLLTLTASFNVIAAGKRSGTLLPEQSVRAEVAYLTTPNRPLLAASEKRTVMKDLEAELCRKIILRLATIAR